MKQLARILIVDDEEHIRKIMSIMLGKRGYECFAAASGEEALEFLEKENFDAVLTDMRMPGIDGLELLAQIKQNNPEQMVLMITAHGTMDIAVQAMKAGAYDFIAKPFKEEEIVLTLEKALERERLLDENKRLKKQIRERFDSSVFLGQSLAMQKVFEIISKVAETRATVLITGPSGTGKELAARSIHFNGARGDKAFIAVNCGAIPANLMESEFFGHVKGAFTGAGQAKKGLIAEADGGTLFLDEVAELPLDMQVKLLRVLQEEEIRRLGETSSHKIDLRVLAATNKNLAEEVQAGRFREDLFYRLNVISLVMPSLNERPEDIPMLAEYFLTEAVKKNSLREKKLSPSAMRILLSHNWPGNVRALRNAIEQGAIMSDGINIEDKDFSFATGFAPEESFCPPQTNLAADGEKFFLSIAEGVSDLKPFLKDISEAAEREIIARVLKAHKGNRTHASSSLGISRRALISKIQLYGFD